MVRTVQHKLDLPTKRTTILTARWAVAHGNREAVKTNVSRGSQIGSTGAVAQANRVAIRRPSPIIPP